MKIQVTTDENIGRLHDMVMDIRQQTIQQTVDDINISFKRVADILHNSFDVTKVFAPSVVRLLAPDQKPSRLITSNQENSKRDQPQDVC